MRAEIISVGTELLAGDVVNTNIAFLSRELSMLGFDVRHQSVVGDDREDIVDALKVAVSRSHLTVFTGGLGPTEDDFTKETVAGALGLKLVMHEPTMAKIKEFFESRSLEMTNNNIKQALVIEDSTVLDNENGTAPGLFIKKGNQAIALLPGPPKELEPLFEKKLKQYLAAMTGKAVASASLHVFGIGESELETKVKDLLYRENPSAALYAKTGEVNINISAKADNITDAEAMLRAGMLQFRERLGEYIYSEDGSSMAETVVGQLMDAGVKVAVAESCTGGLLASMITEVNGSSIVFEYGLSAYADWVKRASLSVNNGILQKYTAISSATAAEMAKGARTNGHSQIGVGITGIAGPTSGDYVGKPVGLVYIAVCDKTNVVVKKFNFGNLRGRTAVQELSAKNALDMIRRFLAGIEIPDSKGFANNIIADIEKDGKASKINSIAIKKGITSVLAVSLLITCGVLVGAKVLRQKSTDNYNNVGAEFLASSSGGQFIQQGLRDLKEQNADTEAWIRVGAGTENVVVRDKGDGYYEKHDFYGSESPFGCPYIKQGLDDIANTDNIILYACIDEGTAFADLRKLIADQEYISANREITLTTLYDETKYKIVSVYYANTDEASGAVDSGFEFSDFKNGDGFINYVVDFKMRSLWNYDVDIVSGDRFVTIVSDLPDWKGAKLVIVARAVRDGELDNQNQLMPQKNFSALYPKKWYDVNKASPVLNETVEKDKWYNWFIANEKSIKFVQDAHNTGGVIDFTRGYESAVGNDGQVVITVYINGQRMTDTPLNIVSMIVMSETGGTFTEEATKAQAVATVSLLKYELQSAEVPHFEGNTPTEEVKKLVEQVINEGMFYDGKIIYAPYFEISAGPTCSALDFWGIEYPYLQSVESPYDYQVYGYTRNTSYPLEAIRARIESYFDIKLSSNQSNWMKIIDYTASGYVKNVNVDDQIVSTGAELYEKVLGIRSSNFAMTWYESSANVLTTGYGHCVGMSKEGADLYAINKGWNYHEILSHYYTGVSFGAVEW